MMWFVIEAAAVVGWDELDPEDVDESGDCSVDGCYLLEAQDETAALDRFHDKVPIACLDDFLITLRPLRSNDAPDSFREIA